MRASGKIGRRELLQLTSAVSGFAVLPKCSVLAEALTLPEVSTEESYVAFLDPMTKINRIYATDLILTDSLIPKDVATIIRADRITISGNVTTRGNNLTMFAREVVSSQDEAILDSRPPGASPDFAGRPAAPSGDRGQPGSNGRDGGPGQPGGNITIAVGRMHGKLTINTSGAKGGDAESGGRGGDGVVGPVGAPPRGQGGRGGTGGAGGLTGKPGKAGDGGAISIRYLDGTPVPVIVAMQNAGRPGTPGRHGEPGSGGPGGPGGSGRESEWVCD